MRSEVEIRNALLELPPTDPQAQMLRWVLAGGGSEDELPDRFLACVLRPTNGDRWLVRVKRIVKKDGRLRDLDRDIWVQDLREDPRYYATVVVERIDGILVVR